MLIEDAMEWTSHTAYGFFISVAVLVGAIAVLFILMLKKLKEKK